MINSNAGVATIEACILMPIVISITILLFWLSLYYYNIGVMSDCAGVAAIYGSEHGYLSNTELKEVVENKLQELLKDQTVLMKTPDVEITVDFSNITVELKALMEAPSFIPFAKSSGEGSWDINVKHVSPRLKPAVFVRTVERLSEATSEE